MLAMHSKYMSANHNQCLAGSWLSHHARFGATIKHLVYWTDESPFICPKTGPVVENNSDDGKRPYILACGIH